MDVKQLVVGIGEALWDMIPSGRKIGGAPANFAFHASQFSLDGAVVSAVGSDLLGDEIISSLNGVNLSCHIARVPYPTGTVDVALDSNGIPEYSIAANVAWDNISFTPELASLALNAKAVCFGTLAQRNQLSRDTIKKFLDVMIASNNDSLRIFDINLRQKFYSPEVISDSLNRCNILKINDEELPVLCSLLDISQDNPKLILERFGLKVLILTCGAHGSHVFTPTEESHLGTPQVQVADTVGAGDSFTGSFAAAMLHGASATEAHHLAVDVAAHVCTQHGAMPRLPENLLKRI